MLTRRATQHLPRMKKKKGADDIQKKGKISQLLYGRAINNGQKSTAFDRRPLENTNGNNTNQRPIIDDERVVRLVYNNSSRSGRSK